MIPFCATRTSLRFGAEHDAYASQVGRWLPRLTPYRPDERDGAGPA